MNAPAFQVQVQDFDLKKIGDAEGFAREVMRVMDEQNQFTVAHISEERMRGNDGKPFPPTQGILGVISGYLRKSLRASDAVAVAGDIQSTIGSNVVYAAIHEFGGVIRRTQLAGSVRLRTDAKGNLLRQAANSRLLVFAKASHKRVMTMAYDGGKRYEIVMPARAPITRGIEDRLLIYAPALDAAITKFLNN